MKCVIQLAHDDQDTLTLVALLRNGTLNEAQQETVRVLRAGIVALAER